MKCCICGKTIKGYGNNPDPLRNEVGNYFDINERCCDACDEEYVVAYRLAQIYSATVTMNVIQDQVTMLVKKNAPKIKKLIAIIERTDGSTYEQEIEYKDTINKSIKAAQKFFGKDRIVDTYTEAR